MRKRDLEQCRTLLLEERERILGNVGRVLSGELDVDRDDFPDEIDTAVAESILSFTGQPEASCASVRRTFAPTCSRASKTSLSGSTTPLWLLGPADRSAYEGETALRNSRRLALREPWFPTWRMSTSMSSL